MVLRKAENFVAIIGKIFRKYLLKLAESIRPYNFFTSIDTIPWRTLQQIVKTDRAL